MSEISLFDLRHTTQSCIMLASSSQLSFSCSDRLSHITIIPLVLLFPPKRVDLLVPPTERKDGQTSLLLHQILWHY